MKKIKQWLWNRFLPTWCREELLEENARLHAKVQTQAQELERLRAYIDGMHHVLRQWPGVGMRR